MSISTSTQIDLSNPTIGANVSVRAEKTNPIKKVLSIFTKVPKSLLFIILGLVVVFGLYTIYSNLSSGPSKILPLSQNFSVTALTQDSKTTNGKLQIQVTGAQKATSMLVQGSNVVVKNNKIFLIVNMDITNNYLVPLYTYPVDSFRLVGVDGKQYAPTTHQGNVEVRPQSTKSSNVGFVVPNSQTRFKIEVGSLTGSKTVLEFSL